MKNSMGITPNVPGTGPVTDVPQTGNDPYQNEPGAPDIKPGGDIPGEEQPESARHVNPFSGSPTGGTGHVNPSDPTTGTEDWGRRPDEAQTSNSPAGQARRSETMANPENIREKGSQNVNFRCSEIHPECKWEASGRSADEVMPQIEQHGREKHGLQSLTQELKDKIRSMMHRTAA